MTDLMLLRSRIRRARTDERGAGMVEMALVFPILVMLVLGVFEFGMAWRSSLTVSNALRSAARSGANSGEDRMADHNVIAAAVSAMAKADGATITKLVIFKSNTANGAVPSQCLTASALAAGGVSSGGAAAGVRCNVYDGADLATLEPSDFSGTPDCDDFAVDKVWCPTSRNAAQAAGADYLGIYIEVRQDFQTGFFGSGITIKDTAIMRLEPEAR